MQLNANDLDFVIHALRVAAEHYDADALVCSGASMPHLAAQFVWQADHARTLAAQLENEE